MREWSIRVVTISPGEISGVPLTSLVTGDEYAYILKADIEGSEFALCTNTDFMTCLREKVSILAMEVHDELGDAEALRANLARNFKLHIVGENIFGVNSELC